MTAALDMREEHLAILQTVLGASLPAGARAYVFGSRAHGGARPYSDLDLAMVDPAFRQRIAADCIALPVGPHGAR